MLEEELREEATLSELRAAYNRLLVKHDKLKRTKEEELAAIYQAMRDGIAALGTPAPVKAPTYTGKGSREDDAEVALMLWSDWQLGKRTGNYNSEVCAQRMHAYLDKVDNIVRIHRTEHPVKQAVTFYMGDQVEGEMIFAGQSHQIDASITRQVMSGVSLGIDLERRKLAMFESSEDVCVIGNHGRLGTVKSEYNPESNNDRLMYLFLQKYFENEPRIKWNIPWEQNKRSSLAVADVAGWKFLVTHGDLIRGGFAGLPWYGFYKKMLGWVTALTMQAVDEQLAFKYFACGHWHNPTSMQFNGIRGWVNGTTESDNEYAMEQLAAAGRPCQWLLFVHPRRGVTAEYLITLD